MVTKQVAVLFSANVAACLLSLATMISVIIIHTNTHLLEFRPEIGQTYVDISSAVPVYHVTTWIAMEISWLLVAMCGTSFVIRLAAIVFWPFFYRVSVVEGIHLFTLLEFATVGSLATVIILMISGVREVMAIIATCAALVSICTVWLSNEIVTDGIYRSKNGIFNWKAGIAMYGPIINLIVSGFLLMVIVFVFVSSVIAAAEEQGSLPSVYFLLAGMAVPVGLIVTIVLHFMQNMAYNKRDPADENYKFSLLYIIVTTVYPQVLTWLVVGGLIER